MALPLIAVRDAALLAVLAIAHRQHAAASPASMTCVSSAAHRRHALRSAREGAR